MFCFAIAILLSVAMLRRFFDAACRYAFAMPRDAAV